MTPFINIFNEFYAKDTSRKIRAVFKAKGQAGKPERINGQKVQKMRIVWNCIGKFIPPQPKKDKKTA